MGMSWILFIVWNMINDPLIGIIEERTKSKLGRRIPYLRYGAPFYVIAFILVWFPIADTNSGLLWNHLIVLFIFDTVYSMIGLVTYSMPAEMAVTAKARSSIVIFNTVISAIGMVGAFVIPAIFLGDVPDITGFRVTSIILAVLSGALIYGASYFIKENKYTQMEEPLGFWESIKETFKNKAFLIVEVSIFAMVIMQNILQGYIVFVFDFVIDLDLTNILNYFLFAILLGTAGYMIYFINKKVGSWGIREITIIFSLIAAVGFVIFLIVGSIIDISPTNKIPLIAAFFPLLLLVIGMIAYMIVNQPLIGDCIDNDELLTGKRRETTYSGVNALITKPAVSIANYIFLIIIEYFGYDENIVDPKLQDPSVSTGVLLAFTIIPAVCLIIAAIAIYFYPLHGPEWEEKKMQIQKTHIAKEKRYIEKMKEETE